MKTFAMAGLAAASVAAWSLAAAQPAPPPGPPPAPAARPAGPPPPPARGPSSALALEAAQEAIATCGASGYKVTAVVVNSSGSPRVMLSADGAPEMTAQIGLRKAFTALTFKEPSGQVGEQAKTDTALAAKIAADQKLITWAGGQPLMVGNDVIGAIGVSGAPGGDKDDACTSAGIAKIKDRLQ
jgi:uncharacterized protein GlcG (DUF336 family)